MNLSCKPKRSPEIAWRSVEDEAVLVDPKNGTVYPLNPVAAFCWRRCDGRLSAAEIIDEAFGEFEADERQIEKDLADFIEQLLEKGLVKIDA